MESRRASIATSSSGPNGLGEESAVIMSGDPSRTRYAYYVQKGRTDLDIVKRSSKVFEDFSWKRASVGVVFAVRPRLRVTYNMLELGYVSMKRRCRMCHQSDW